MNESRSWLKSRHLARSDRGRVALEHFDALAPELREAILKSGDELAAVSVTMAHGFFAGAVALARSQYAGNADEWEQQGRLLLREAGAGRAIAQAWFSLPPEPLCRATSAARAALVDAACSLSSGSRRLAATFMEEIGAALCDRRLDDNPKSAAIAELSIRAWHSGCSSTLEHSRWRGEFLASRFLESARELANKLTPESVEAWSTVLARVGAAGRGARCPQAPVAIAALDPELQSAALQCCAALSARSPLAAERALEILPAALVALPQETARALIDATHAAMGPKDDELVDALAYLAAEARTLPPDDLPVLTAMLREVARRFPAGVIPFLRVIDRALELGGGLGLELWARRGCELGERNKEAGVAHFRLRTRTANKVLVEHSTAVTLSECEPVLQRYLVMMARRTLQIASGGGTWLRPPLAAPEDRSVRLPESVDLWDTSEENQAFYKLAVAHAAGRWEYGTFSFRIGDLGEIPPGLARDPEGDDIIALIDSFPNPLLAAGLFIVLDGARIDACLTREFSGLAADLDRLGRAYAARSVRAAADRSPEEIIETLFLLSVGRVPVSELPQRLRATGERLAATVARLQSPSATVEDSVRAMIALYGSLNLAAAMAQGDPDVLAEMGGATVLDLLDYLEDSPAAPAIDGESVDASASTGEDGDGFSELHDPPQLELTGDEPTSGSAGMPLSPEELKKLIEKGVEIELSEARGPVDAGLGMYITELLGKLPADTAERLREMIDRGDTPSIRAWLAELRGKDFYWYDEWDHRITDYRHRWCRVSEMEIDGDGGRYFNRMMGGSADLVARIKREFLLMRPEQFRKVRGMQDGEDFDINALVDAHADRRTRRTPTDRLYVARRREERDVATLFLIDMSASTDEPLPGTEDDPDARRVIDVTKDTLAVMANVLEEIGDAYAMYGFSGHGHDGVEYYHVKAFNERLGPTVRSRLGGVEPKRSTRMGAALRHSRAKLAGVTARARHLILLSDGFPQDHDYGDDRRSNVYGIRDTMTALRELEAEGVSTFCITVDPAGHDYLGDMCPATRYAVIEDIEALPEEMPRIYRSVTRC